MRRVGSQFSSPVRRSVAAHNMAVAPLSGAAVPRLPRLALLKNRYPIVPTGRVVWGDIRDTAATIVAMIGAPPARNAYFGPIRTLPDLAALEALQRVTGRRLPAMLVPASVALSAARVTAPVLSRLPGAGDSRSPRRAHS